MYAFIQISVERYEIHYFYTTVLCIHMHINCSRKPTAHYLYNTAVTSFLPGPKNIGILALSENFQNWFTKIIYLQLLLYEEKTCTGGNRANYTNIPQTTCNIQVFMHTYKRASTHIYLPVMFACVCRGCREAWLPEGCNSLTTNTCITHFRNFCVHTGHWLYAFER